MGRPILDLTGQTYGRLHVRALAGVSRTGNALWECECECGKVKVVAGGNLRHNVEPTISCGCAVSDRARARNEQARARPSVSADEMKDRARQRLNRAIREGLVQRGPCARTGEHRGKIEGHHHHGYAPDHWLDVEWLCEGHHEEVERGKA